MNRPDWIPAAVAAAYPKHHVTPLQAGGYLLTRSYRRRVELVVVDEDGTALWGGNARIADMLQMLSRMATSLTEYCLTLESTVYELRHPREVA